jgi:hypothetical protein
MRLFGVLSFALTLTILLASEARGQSASVTVSGHVSEAVFVSIAPGAQMSDGELLLTHTNLNTHTVLLSISASDVRRISIPVQLRSNVGYTLSASANLSGARLRGLCVTGARATGKFVATGAVEAVNMTACEEATAGARSRNVSQAAQPFFATLLTGTKISLAGTFDTPSNALEVTLLVEIEPHDGQEHGVVELILSATPESHLSANRE